MYAGGVCSPRSRRLHDAVPANRARAPAAAPAPARADGRAHRRRRHRDRPRDPDRDQARDRAPALVASRAHPRRARRGDRSSDSPAGGDTGADSQSVVTDVRDAEAILAGRELSEGTPLIRLCPGPRAAAADQRGDAQTPSTSRKRTWVPVTTSGEPLPIMVAVAEGRSGKV